MAFPKDQQDQMDRRAADAAKREYERDPNRTDRKHTQDRMDAAVHVVRVRMGLEKE